MLSHYFLGYLKKHFALAVDRRVCEIYYKIKKRNGRYFCFDVKGNIMRFNNSYKALLTYLPVSSLIPRNEIEVVSLIS